MTNIDLPIEDRKARRLGRASAWPLPLLSSVAVALAGVVLTHGSPVRFAYPLFFLLVLCPAFWGRRLGLWVT